MTDGGGADDDGGGTVLPGSGVRVNEMDEIAELLGLRSSDVGSVVRAIQSLENKVNDVVPLETLNKRIRMLDMIADKLEADAVKEEEKDGDDKDDKDVVVPPSEKKRKKDYSWDEEDQTVLEVSVMLAGDEEEEDRDEYTHRKVASLAETFRQLEDKKKELIGSLSIDESDVDVVLPIINALTPIPEAATDEQRFELEHQEDMKLTSLLDRAISNTNERLRDLTKELEQTVAQL